MKDHLKGQEISNWKYEDVALSQKNMNKKLGTIHLRRQNVLVGEGCPHVAMVQRSQYIRIKNHLHKHFAGMPVVEG